MIGSPVKFELHHYFKNRVLALSSHFGLLTAPLTILDPKLESSWTRVRNEEIVQALRSCSIRRHFRGKIGDQQLSSTPSAE